MNELQVSLLGIGAAVVLALYGYNWWQQRQYRRKFGAALKPHHDDALYRPDPEKSASVNLTTGDSGRESLAEEMEQALSVTPLTDGATCQDSPLRTHVNDEVCALLDVSTDYIAVISPKIPAGADALARLWQQRFDFGKHIHVCGLDATTDTWGKVIAESRAPYAKFKLALQLVNRSGAVSEARLGDFHDLARAIAAQIQASVVLPDVAATAARALELDNFCAAVDQMIGLNILPGGEHWLSGNDVARVATQYGLSLQADGSFHLPDGGGHTLFSLSSLDNTPFQHHTLHELRVNGLTLLLDVPRVEQPALRFDQMVEVARQIARDLHAVIADDHHVALSEASILLIREQIVAIEGNMLAGHIISGSAQARRLFS